MDDTIFLADIVAEFLKSKNQRTFCMCGNSQSHHLTYCHLCGREFRNGYTPPTMGDRIKFLIGKPNRAEGYSPGFQAAIMIRKFRKQLNNPNLTESEITIEIEKQLGIGG